MRMRAILSAFFLGLSWHACDAAQPDALIYQTDFESPAARAAWVTSDYASWQSVASHGTVLTITVPTAHAEAPDAAARLKLGLTPYRGKRVNFFCRAKAERVTKPHDSWNGIKFMLYYRTPSKGEQWESLCPAPFGSFDWKPLAFQLTLPDDIGEAELTLGLQDSCGRVSFDDVRLELDKQQMIVRPQPMKNPPPAFTGHIQPRLRGAMVECEFNDANLRTLGQEWGANLIRWQITRAWGETGKNRDLAEYDRWLNGRLAELDQVLEACTRYGMKAVIDLHTPAGGRYEDQSLAMFYEKIYADAFVRMWEKIARRYKGNPSVWAYDLVNEPTQSSPVPEGLDNYWDLQIRAARAVRAIDPDTVILFEVDDWDSPGGFRFVAPVDIPRVVYQVHMYEPHAFTHQKVESSTVPELRYPGLIDGVPVNKETLRKTLQPVRDFQLAYNVAIYVGEFSAIRWAPGACGYLRDCIDIFEEYGWDWSYHAFREWDGWSVEHGSDISSHEPASAPTDRQRLLCGWFGKNRSP